MGHNPLFNLSRRLKQIRGRKMAWTVAHVRRMADFENAERYFSSVQIHFFDLLTPFLVPVLSIIPAPSRDLLRMCWFADRILLKSLPFALRVQALKIACILKRPAK